MRLRCTQEHARLGLAAKAWWLSLMWTVIYLVDYRAGSFKLAAHPSVHQFHFSKCDKPLRDTTLVANDKHQEPSIIEQADGLTHAGEKIHLLPTSDILAFGSFTVDYAVAIKKNCLFHGKPPETRFSEATPTTNEPSIPRYKLSH